MSGDLRADETLAKTKLSPGELNEILKQVEETAFDNPDDWRSELRARRVSLGATEGLVLQGSKLLCGGTANCELWVFRQVGQHWLNMFEQQAPMADAFQLQAGANPIQALSLCSNTSVSESACELYAFDGKIYRRVECFSVIGQETSAPKMTKTHCSQDPKGD